MIHRKRSAQLLFIAGIFSASLYVDAFQGEVVVDQAVVDSEDHIFVHNFGAQDQEEKLFESDGEFDEFDEFTNAMDEDEDFVGNFEIKQDSPLMYWIKRIGFEVVIKYLALKQYIESFFSTDNADMCNEQSKEA